MSEDKKVLKCEFHGDKWNDYIVVSLRVDTLWASVPRAINHRGRPFYENVKKDIEENGLKFPLIVVDAKRKHLIEQKNRYGNKVCELPFDRLRDDLEVRQYTVWGGSNRWWVAKELGYEAVDCIVVPNADFNKARGMQAMHRAPFKGTLY